MSNGNALRGEMQTTYRERLVVVGVAALEDINLGIVYVRVHGCIEKAVFTTQMFRTDTTEVVSPSGNVKARQGTERTLSGPFWH